MSGEEDLIDYSDEELQPTDGATAASNGAAKKGDATASGAGAGQAKGSYVGIHSTSFRDFLLKPELLKAITDCGFEHPSEVQQSTIPQAILGTDILAQAKSGLGKTAVFVLSTLQQLEPVDGEVSVLVLCHTRELAFQIRNEYLRFTKYMPTVKTAVFYGGTDIKENEKLLRDKETHPHIIVATPGRLNALVRDKKLRLGSVNRFVLDECDKMLEQIDMRRDVQEIFRATPTQKQVMMFSATLSPQIRPICKKFMQNPLELFSDDGSEKLTLHGLQLFYVKLSEAEKNRRLNDLLDELTYNQVIIFVKSTVRATELDRLLRECNFPSIAVHSGVSQEERIKRYTAFKNYDKRICVSTDVFGRGIDFERINLVVNYDMPETQSPGVSDKEILAMSADTYLHRVGRGGRFGTKAIAISFIANERDEQILQAVESRFERKVDEYPEGGKGVSVEGKD